MANATKHTRQSASQSSIDDPPPYMEPSRNALLLRSSPPSSGAARRLKSPEASVPPSVHLVQAPYEFRRKNERVVRDFLLSKGDWGDLYLPDISLRTKNALLHSAVYIEAQEWELPVFVHARTKNGDMALSIHPLQTDQAVRVRASTKNGTLEFPVPFRFLILTNFFEKLIGRNDTLLPHDFKGVLMVSTKNGKCALSTELKKVAVRIPNGYKKTAKDEESFGRCSSSDSMVRDIPSDLSDGVEECYEINGCREPSFVDISTKNGDVSVGFIQNEEVGCWGGCLIM